MPDDELADAEGNQGGRPWMMTPEQLANRHAKYWDALTEDYQNATRISLNAFHLGPLLPSANELGILPSPLEGLRCLELGCGGGQNSIVLAKSGARCTGIDLSENMLAWGRLLSEKEDVDVDFIHASMDALPAFADGFDIIHSAYGLPFSADPSTVVQRCSALLKPGGLLIVSLGHPVYAGEWLDLDEGEQGIFLKDYFHPLEDERADEAGEAVARAYPLSTVCDWLYRAGLKIERLLEPAAAPVHTMSPREIERDVPYYSEGWAEQVNELMKFPIVLVVVATKPTESA